MRRSNAEVAELAEGAEKRREEKRREERRGEERRGEERRGEERVEREEKRVPVWYGQISRVIRAPWRARLRACARSSVDPRSSVDRGMERPGWDSNPRSLRNGFAIRPI
jgi:hypothetical protein